MGLVPKELPHHGLPCLLIEYNRTKAILFKMAWRDVLLLFNSLPHLGTLSNRTDPDEAASKGTASSRSFMFDCKILQPMLCSLELPEWICHAPS